MQGEDGYSVPLSVLRGLCCGPSCLASGQVASRRRGIRGQRAVFRGQELFGNTSRLTALLLWDASFGDVTRLVENQSCILPPKCHQEAVAHWQVIVDSTLPKLPAEGLVPLGIGLRLAHRKLASLLASVCLYRQAGPMCVTGVWQWELL